MIMKLSTKGRYGLRAMIDLALYSEKEPASIASIAARQHISESYLEQLIAKLRKAGLVTSVRGACGGYVPGRPVEEISVEMCSVHWKEILTRWNALASRTAADVTVPMCV